MKVSIFHSFASIVAITAAFACVSGNIGCSATQKETGPGDTTSKTDNMLSGDGQKRPDPKNPVCEKGFDLVTVCEGGGATPSEPPSDPGGGVRGEPGTTGGAAGDRDPGKRPVPPPGDDCHLECVPSPQLDCPAGTRLNGYACRDVVPNRPGDPNVPPCQPICEPGDRIPPIALECPPGTKLVGTACPGAASPDGNGKDVPPQPGACFPLCEPDGDPSQGECPKGLRPEVICTGGGAEDGKVPQPPPADACFIKCVPDDGGRIPAGGATGTKN